MTFTRPGGLGRTTRGGAASVTDAPGPAVLRLESSHVRVGDGYTATLAVTGYPAEVGPAWLEALLAYPGRVDVAVHIDPVPAVLAAPMLRRQRARFESTRRLDADAGRLGDPLIEAAAGDAAGLAERVARGAGKLFGVGIYVSVHARTLSELREACAGVRAAAASVLLDLQPATFRHHLGYTSTLPLCADRLGMHRILDTDALAAAFPFSAPDLPASPPGQVPSTGAVLYGTTPTGVLMWDRWAGDNHNSVVLGRSGAGKSHFVKLDILRQTYQGVRVTVIDPEDEYAGLVDHVGGSLIQLGTPGVRINPLALPAGRRAADTLTRCGLMLHTVVAVMLGEKPTPAQATALDHAITLTYQQAGITSDPVTWDRPAPLMSDLAASLSASGDPAGKELADRLYPWTHGSYADLVAGPTTPAPTLDDTPAAGGGHLTVWSLRHLPEEVRAVAMLLVLDAIWRDVDSAPSGHDQTPVDAENESSQLRRMIVVDEAWMLMREHEGARFLARMAKSGRKRRAALSLVTQDAADILSTDLGLAVVSNAATQILLRQAPQAIDTVQHAFGLTDGEARLLLTAAQGDALLIAGSCRVPFHVVASPAETAVARSGIGGDR